MSFPFGQITGNQYFSSTKLKINIQNNAQQISSQILSNTKVERKLLISIRLSLCVGKKEHEKNKPKVQKIMNNKGETP